MPMPQRKAIPVPKPPRRQGLETAYRTLIVDFVTRPASLRCAGTESM
jgi:hypothetical protein